MTQAFDLTWGWWAEDEAADDASEWNTAQVGEDWLPGIIKITGLEPQREIERKHAKGEDGESLKDNGKPAVDFTIEVQLADKVDWIGWCKVYPKLDPRRKGAAKTPLAILHPLVNMVGINNVYIDKISPDWPDAESGMTWRIHCIEWLPAPKKTKANASGKAKPKASTPISPALIQTTSSADYLNALFRDRGI